MKIKYIIPILLVFLIINVGFSTQADNVEIYQSVPNPSILAANQEQTVYFVIYNTGNETINLTQITHDWGRNYVSNVESAYIGNDKIGYQDVTENLTFGKRFPPTPGYSFIYLSTSLEIEPNNFIEFYYEFDSSVAGMAAIGLNTNFILYLEDNSIKTRSSNIHGLPTGVIQKDFEIENNFYSTAKGANDTLFPNTNYVFSIRTTNFGNEQYENEIIIEFPEEFSNVHSEDANCTLNICSCSVNLTQNNFEICEINATTPIELGHYIIHANDSKQILDNDVISVSELLVRIMPSPVCPKPTVVSTDVTPTEIYFGESVTIRANVTGSDITPGIGGVPIKSVWAVINGTDVTLEFIEGDKQGNATFSGIFEVEYTPPTDGNFSVIVYVENMCDAVANGTIEYFIVKPPTQPPSPQACRDISHIGLAKRPGVLDQNKLESLFFNLNYFCTKNILGLWDYEIFMELTYPDGTYVNLQGKNLFYGRAPGRMQTVYGIRGEAMQSPYYSIVSDSNRVDYPMQRRTTRIMRFSRMALLETDSGYELVRLTLGVWI